MRISEKKEVKKMMGLGLNVRLAIRLIKEKQKRESLIFSQRFVKEENHFTKYDGIQIR